MDDHLFRRAMANFTTGITVVTTENNREIHGMTANAFMSISLEPKLIAISVDHRTNMYKKNNSVETICCQYSRQVARRHFEVVCKSSSR